MTRSRRSAKTAGAAFERWRDIPGWQGFYQASSQGRIRSVHRVVIRSDGQNRTETSHVMRGSVNAFGYRYVRLTRDAKSVSRLIHCLIAETFLGPRPPGLQVCHNNGTPTDNRVENLRWDTPQANARDMVRHGRNSIAKTECPRGHPLEAPNLVRCVAAKGYRECLACCRARSWIRQYGGDLKQVSDDRYLRIAASA